MSPSGSLHLRKRRFEVSTADLSYHANDTWSIDIHTQDREFGGELWAPYLYHQGLRLPAKRPETLVGVTAAWGALRSEGYPHPEFGFMCVFGHHDVYECEIAFGPFVAGQVAVSWSGLCDVFWDKAFSERVPFSCQAMAQIGFLHPDGWQNRDL